MTFSIRYALVALPLGMIISGCASPQQSVATSHRGPRNAQRSSSLVVDLDDGPRVDKPAGATLNDNRYDISQEQIRQHLQDNSAVVIDARSPSDFARGHVRDAINLPAGEIAKYMPQIEENVSRHQLIIIYCASSSCGSSDMVYEYLGTQGYTNMRVYKPGWLKLAFAANLR